MRARVVALGLLLVGCAGTPSSGTPTTTHPTGTGTLVAGPATELPTPDLDAGDTLRSTLSSRRSVRAFAHRALTRTELGQLLWAAQGVTSADGKRTTPSAGALYPLEVLAATAEGVWHYRPEGHRVARVGDTDVRPGLARAAAGQAWVADAPVVVVLVGVEARTAAKYGDRAERYVAIEVGHAAQNVLLQATALGLGGTPVGALDEGAARELLGLPADHTPLLLVPVGQPRPDG